MSKVKSFKDLPGGSDESTEGLEAVTSAELLGDKFVIWGYSLRASQFTDGESQYAVIRIGDEKGPNRVWNTSGGAILEKLKLMDINGFFPCEVALEEGVSKSSGRKFLHFVPTEDQ